MPGPKMGPCPADFDEEVIRQAPTFIKWQSLKDGQKLRYACREFIKGHGDDEERLMRRIMIARRNNLRDHETLKHARITCRVVEASPFPDHVKSMNVSKRKGEVKADHGAEEAASAPKKRRAGNSPHSTGMSDAEVAMEMDVPAVEATRSYQAWMALEDGQEFTYNQRYIKGKEGHDWLLRKNIWRRMRYRRENKRMVDRVKSDVVAPKVSADQQVVIARAAAAAAATQIVDQALLASAAAAANTVPPTVLKDEPGSESLVEGLEVSAASREEGTDFVHKAVVDAAVAAAEKYVKGQAASVIEDAQQSLADGDDAANIDNIAAMSVPTGESSADTDAVSLEVKVGNPLEAAATSAALEAAAKLAETAPPLEGTAPVHVEDEGHVTIDALSTAAKLAETAPPAKGTVPVSAVESSMKEGAGEPANIEKDDEPSSAQKVAVV